MTKCHLIEYKEEYFLVMNVLNPCLIGKGTVSTRKLMITFDKKKGNLQKLNRPQSKMHPCHERMKDRRTRTSTHSHTKMSSSAKSTYFKLTIKGKKQRDIEGPP